MMGLFNRGVSNSDVIRLAVTMGRLAESLGELIDDIAETKKKQNKRIADLEEKVRHLTSYVDNE